MKRGAKQVALLGLLGALTLALSFLESLLPPLPGVPPGFKVGLSNIVTMYAAGTLGLPAALFLAVLKGGFALLGRGAAAGAMSLSGGLFSTVCVWLLCRRPKLSLLTVSVCGALAHNAGQLCCACLLTGTAVLVYGPLLIVFGVLAGILTGLILRLTFPLLSRLES